MKARLVKLRATGATLSKLPSDEAAQLRAALRRSRRQKTTINVLSKENARLRKGAKASRNRIEMLEVQLARLRATGAVLSRALFGRKSEKQETPRSDDPGRRTDLRDGGECLCAADGELPPGSRLRRLDRADATAEFDGRQATAWPHHKDGTARLAPLAHSGCDSRCLANAPAQGGIGSLAPKDDRGKPPKLVAVALANKMARTIWALSIKKETYRAPVAVGVAG